MSNPELELDLGILKEQRIEEMPELVRVRMDQTYQMLSSVPPKPVSVKKKSRWLRNVMITTASVAAGGVIFISLGFISPAMAQTLKQIPFVDSVFRLAGDLGLQTANEKGMTAAVHQTVTHQGVTLSVSELMYDGSRLSLVLTRDMPEDANETFYDLWGSEKGPEGLVNNIDFFINGEPVNTSWGISSGGDQAPDSLIVTTFESVEVPDEFDFSMVVRIAKLNQDFEFNISVKKNNTNSIVLTPAEMKTHDHIHMKIKRIELSQTTTRLVVEIRGEPGEYVREFQQKIPDKYKITGFLNIDFDLTDEQGRTPAFIGGSGSGEGDYLSYTTMFEPMEATPKTVTVKPYIRSRENKVYIPELEFTVPVQ
ncbi:DUF4179 domain-containing protein [Paenibacillus etheri]|uniref:DUF4179 domain-containing protein n=1 Tax=Paenibacillus etheri TaxID=1306852 RepID=A0A0W1B550_9BACL|nr:DUF4179 domain-containing protein [Paenibacillus etheri]KTD88690.1 hypothetical protein UQ64_03695 [Paenibacillus etheri]